MVAPPLTDLPCTACFGNYTLYRELCWWVV